jgi:predicted GNAT superfamily acetyltransferase
MLIREATSHRDLDEAVLIQREVWNVVDTEIVGRIQLKASQHAGGSVLVAEAGDGSIGGFAYAFPAFVHGKLFWHSDMLAVRPAHRGMGMGQALKWGQRTEALSKGIRCITWTFDPMQAGNAHLNLELLGATVAEYLANFYGITTSALHHGLPTDRLLASWDLESPRVQFLARGETPPPLHVHSRVAIPADWNALVQRNPEGARAVQTRVETGLSSAFWRGLVVAGFDKSCSSYLLMEGGSK